ncbi:MAG: paraquat-inducible protein A [Methylococcaceae bacterium]|nr:paraquat-inducible protein A [Methylococcaceae bacterium]MCI0732305.1 paraquat-inducible protein A [Methylococcaceae bacterium]
MHQKISLLLFMLALGLLIPGLNQPMLTLEASVSKKEMLDLAADSLIPERPDNSIIAQFAHAMIENLRLEGSVEIYKKTRSILGTMNDLFSSGNYFVAILIGLFAVVVPLVKLFLTALAALLRKRAVHGSLQNLAGMISKWSMSDVFVMAIIVGYMAANADDHPGDAVRMNAEFGPGFFYFAAYCLTSILSAQFLPRE